MRSLQNQAIPVSVFVEQIQKPAPFSGISRTYRPRDDEGEQLPPESTLVQVRADDQIRSVGEAMSRMLDVVATQDRANTQDRADLVVDDVVLLADAPTTYLMWAGEAGHGAADVCRQAAGA